MQPNDPILYEFRSGLSGDEFIQITEPYLIKNGRILLSEIPDVGHRIQITGYNEIQNADNGILTNQFHVNYRTANVFFNSSEEGKTVTVTFYGKGNAYMSADRVYTNATNGQVTETLQDILDAGDIAIGALDELNQTIEEAEQATSAANTAATNTNNTNTSVQTAESARVTAEQGRVTAESARVTSENTRQTNESNRGTAETNRNTAETGRVNAESARVSAETTRNTNESARQSNETARGTAETNRATAEGNRASAETSRVTTESGRVTAEGNRVTAESARANAENTRSTNETTRQTNEGNRVSAEDSRATAESSRATAESGRSSAESIRVTAETSRTNAESARVTAENGRANAESLRVTAEEEREDSELERISAEDTRSSSETDRNTAEIGRVDAESARVLAESARTSAETTRISAESERSLNEDNRIDAEQDRVSAENARSTAESARASAETTRQNQESARQTNTTQAINDLNALKDSYEYDPIPYDNAKQYLVNTQVSYNGSTYICIVNSLGNLPTNTTYWRLFAAKGQDGAGTVAGIVSSQNHIIVGGTSITPDLTINTEKFASLDGNGKVPLSLIPDVAKQQTYVVDNPSERIALTGLIEGDKAFETSTGDSFIWDGSIWRLMADADWANVSLDWTNITNKPTTFTPPIATSSVLGGVKQGTNISIAVDGTISGAAPYTHPTGDGNLHVPATGTTNNGKVLKAGTTAGSATWGSVNGSEIVQDSSNRLVSDSEKSTWNGKANNTVATTGANGLMSSTDKSKLDGIEANANNYTHPSSHPPSIITQDENNRFVTDAEKSTWNAKGNGDMLKSVYDTNNNGKVNSAEAADTVPWTGITGVPDLLFQGDQWFSWLTTTDGRIPYVSKDVFTGYYNNPTGGVIVIDTGISYLTGAGLNNHWYHLIDLTLVDTPNGRYAKMQIYVHLAGSTIAKVECTQINSNFPTPVTVRVGWSNQNPGGFSIILLNDNTVYTHHRVAVERIISSRFNSSSISNTPFNRQNWSSRTISQIAGNAEFTGVVTATIHTKASTAVVTTNADGLMSAADKIIFDSMINSLRWGSL